MGWVVNVNPRPLYPLVKTRYPSYRRLDRPQGRSGRVQNISPRPGFDPWAVQPAASRYNDWALPDLHHREVQMKMKAIKYCFCTIMSNVCRNNWKTTPCVQKHGFAKSWIWAVCNCWACASGTFAAKIAACICGPGATWLYATEVMCALHTGHLTAIRSLYCNIYSSWRTDCKVDLPVAGMPNFLTLNKSVSYKRMHHNVSTHRCKKHKPRSGLWETNLVGPYWLIWCGDP
jgi:hypothetical protein